MKVLPLLLSAFYLGIAYKVIGFRPEHGALVAVILLFYYAHPKSRRLILDLFPFVLFGVFYDLLRVFPKSWAGAIHVNWPYQLEKILFGFQVEGVRLIPCEYFQRHHWTGLDLLSGLAYSLHMFVPIGFALWVRIRNRPLVHSFVWTFFLANCLAFITYIALPVAPPWYVEQFGLVPADWSIAGSAAGLAQFDQIIGRPYFQEVYARSAWVFGAVPSMHAGFPFLVVLFARKVTRWGLIPLCLFMLLVWFAAVYLRHHYIIDLIAGVIYVMMAFFITTFLSKKSES